MLTKSRMISLERIFFIDNDSFVNKETCLRKKRASVSGRADNQGHKNVIPLVFYALTLKEINSQPFMAFELVDLSAPKDPLVHWFIYNILTFLLSGVQFYREFFNISGTTMKWRMISE